MSKRNSRKSSGVAVVEEVPVPPTEAPTMVAVVKSEGETGAVTPVTTPPTPAKPEVRYSLTKTCAEEFGRHFVTAVPDRERGGVIQYVDVPKNMFYFLSQKVGRPLDVDDVFGPVVQIGDKVKSAAPSLDKEGKKVYMEIDEFSCTLLNIRHFDEWPEFSGGTVTVEYIDKVCQRWAEGHPLAGKPRRLGRYLLSRTNGPQPFHGRIFAPDWDARARFDHSQGQQDADWMGGWMFSESPKSALGRAVNKMMSVLRRDDIIPMPKEDVSALLEAVRNRPAGGQRSQVDDDLDDILGLGGEEEDDRPNYRRDKRSFQGGGRDYRHPRH